MQKFILKYLIIGKKKKNKTSIYIGIIRFMEKKILYNLIKIEKWYLKK